MDRFTRSRDEPIRFAISPCGQGQRELVLVAGQFQQALRGPALYGEHDAIGPVLDSDCQQVDHATCQFRRLCHCHLEVDVADLGDTRVLGAQASLRWMPSVKHGRIPKTSDGPTRFRVYSAIMRCSTLPWWPALRCTTPRSC